MRQIIKIFWVLGLFVQVMLAYAAPAQIEALSFSSQPAGQLVFDIKGNSHYRYFTLQNPSRFVVDFEDATLPRAISQPPAGHPWVVAVRSARRNDADYRIVVELNADANAKVATVNTGQGMQLQVDLSVNATSSKTSASNASRKSTKVVTKSSSKKVFKANGRDIIIAIDAGHGGKDVGAQGGNGTREKDVVLAIAKRLQSAVNQQPGMKAVMIRDGDYFVKLSERVRIARAAKADLLVSIHADAFDDPSAHGASVYTLATKGASSQIAQYLANSENASDVAGGVGNDIHDDTLASVLMDLTNKAAKEASQHIGSKVLKNVKSVGHLHRSSVQRAGFVVLQSPIPSILVETAFISNPEEERRLNSGAYQEKMATAVFKGIVAHFKRYAPANTLFAQLQKSGKSALRTASRGKSTGSTGKLEVASADRVVSPVKHVISQGDTLSGIARHYGVSMREIRNVNDLDDTTVKVGQVLQIPRSS